MSKLFPRIMPFIMIGIALVAFLFGLILLTYLFVFGAIVGLVLYVITWVREKFFSPKVSSNQVVKRGRTIDHDS